jgi:hypothetical protein
MSAHHLVEKLSAHAKLRTIRFDRGKRGRRPLHHFFCGLFGRNDFRVCNQLVAKGMVTVRMRIDQRLDAPRRRYRVTHRVEHLLGKFEIK